MQGAFNGRHRRTKSSAQSDPARTPHPRHTERAGRTAATRTSNYRAIPFAGIRAGEIIAPRVWTLYGDLLHGAFFMGHAWLPHIPAQGDPRVEGAGIHAFKSLDEAFEYADKASDWIFPSGSIVVGHVALWGDVIEHEHGYRAEYGSVYNIVNVVRDNLELDVLCCRYGCEIAQQ
jgi:hypothetical protein